MFLGKQNDLIALIAETREELENAPCMSFTEIVETDEQVEMVGGTYYVGEQAVIEAKKAEKRAERNRLLETEIDPVVSNPLRWADMSDEEKADYTDYRHYLLDYTEQENWWEESPLSFADWKARRNPVEEKPLDSEE